MKENTCEDFYTRIYTLYISESCLKIDIIRYPLKPAQHEWEIFNLNVNACTPRALSVGVTMICLQRPLRSAVCDAK